MVAVETDIERKRRLSYEAARAAVAFGEANPDSDELDLASYSQGYRDAAEQAEAEVRALREALREVFATIDEWVEAGIVILDDDDFRSARALASEPPEGGEG